MVLADLLSRKNDERTGKQGSQDCTQNGKGKGKEGGGGGGAGGFVVFFGSPVFVWSGTSGVPELLVCHALLLLGLAELLGGAGCVRLRLSQALLTLLCTAGLPLRLLQPLLGRL